MASDQDQRATSTHDVAAKTKQNPAAPPAGATTARPADAVDPVKVEGKPNQIKPDGR